MRFVQVLLVLVLMGGAAAVSVWRGWIALPPQWNPWAPLDVKAEPNLLTRYKLMRLRDDPQLCAQALDSSGLRVAPQADSPDAKCPLTDALRVQGGDVALSSSFLASCRLAVSFALFEHHALQPAARAVYGQAVSRVDHLGSFACRSIAGSQRPSQHSYANALDMVGFHLRDGQHISTKPIAEVTEDGAEAAFENGVLKLALPKRATVTSKRLTVR